MAITGIPIDENQCIGDSLSIINSAFQNLDGRAGVTKIIAGTNITISPAGGTGDVTINGAAAVAPGATVTIQDTPPSSPAAGDLWFDSSSGVTSLRYDSTWVDVGGGDSGTSAGSVNGIVKSDGSGNFSAAVAGTDYTAPSNFTGTNQSLATSGYQKLPGGLIIQWGFATEGPVTFPISFPTALRYVGVTGTFAPGHASWLSDGGAVTGFTAYIGPVDSVSSMYWTAIGY